MRKNYVLIDFENVQPENLAALNNEHFHVRVFVGANQKNVALKIVKALQPMGERAEYIEISGNGKNALDFHIAFYIGQLAAKDDAAYFHIISKDAGFDPLIAHLKTRNISAAREADIGEIPLVKATPLAPALSVVQPPLPPPQLIVRPPEPLRLKPSPKPPKPPKPVSPPAHTHKSDPHLLAIIENLRPAKMTKPRTMKRLASHIKSTFPNAMTEAEIGHIIADMARMKHITITDNKIAYHL